MKIILSPIASNRTTTISVDGLIVTIDGTPIDLSVIPEGGQAEADENSPFIGVVTRDTVTIRYEYDSKLAEPNQSTDLADYTFDIVSGEVPCPIKWKPVEAEEVVDVQEY
jgi:hypothetical protein